MKAVVSTTAVLLTTGKLFSGDSPFAFANSLWGGWRGWSQHLLEGQESERSEQSRLPLRIPDARNACLVHHLVVDSSKRASREPGKRGARQNSPETKATRKLVSSTVKPQLLEDPSIREGFPLPHTASCYACKQTQEKVVAFSKSFDDVQYQHQQATAPSQLSKT